MQPERQLETYRSWLKQEGIPAHQLFAVPDVRKLEVGPWARLGGLGAYVQLTGAEEQSGMYLCEIPPGEALNPEVHLFEAVIYVLEGRGCTEFWRTGESRRMVEWQRNSLFALPLDVWHRFINLSAEPSRFMAITNAPLIINLFQNTEFIFAERFQFNDRYQTDPAYFSSELRPAAKPYGEVVYENNFIADLKAVKVEHPPEGTARGEGYARRYLKLGGNRMRTFAAEYPVGTYTTGHWHGGGVTIYIANGEGFTLMWPQQAGMRPWEAGNEDQVVHIPFKEGTVYAPPTGWWHQHFNTGNTPARYVPSGPGLELGDAGTGRLSVYKSVREGGNQIDYDLEDPRIKELFAEAIQQRKGAGVA